MHPIEEMDNLHIAKILRDKTVLSFAVNGTKCHFCGESKPLDLVSEDPEEGHKISFCRNCDESLREKARGEFEEGQDI